MYIVKCSYYIHTLAIPDHWRTAWGDYIVFAKGLGQYKGKHR